MPQRAWVPRYERLSAACCVALERLGKQCRERLELQQFLVSRDNLLKVHIRLRIERGEDG